ncbi:MAG: ABC transporter substrate-binding protein [Phascolarctobacterium sp.]|nr:ABC transporter substrate-binding protein [Phascolarctobacterium sp.]
MKFLYIILSVLLMFSASSCGKKNMAIDNGNHTEYQVVDDEGNVVKMPAKPRKILTTHYHLDTMVMGIVSKDRMMAITKSMADPDLSCMNPKEIEDVPQYGINFLPLETIVRNKPDLIIARSYVGKERLDTYREMGIPVYISKMPNSIEEIQQRISGLAEVTGEVENGKRLNQKITQVLNEIKIKITQDKLYSKSALLVSKMNTNYGGKGCTFDDILIKAGLRNAAADVGIMNGQEISKEIWIKADPDFYILSEGYEKKHKNDPDYKDEFITDPALKNTRAVKNGGLLYLKNKHIYASNQNCVWAIKKLANIAYGNVFPEEEEYFLKGY